ncbi:magnesium transporter [Modestobacter sp. DSM 44400]|uniref:magnesium/cobalt transporter CorA n=1 Tax=Modestobacter sp. DSM 44400 TaxID=1550230 RepID=UPI00089C303A|nr:magnesium/cobalt transporter CorA [Modestobacter sp. DSM 44400]SDY70026.1 magnesium transporter [Modestobacter sp. DSM 44400]
MTSTDSSPGARARLPQLRRPRPAGAPKAAPPQRPGGGDPVVDCAVYVNGRRQGQVPRGDALRVATERDGFVWLGLHEPTEAEFESIAVGYGLHPLAVEDAVYAHQRPKLDSYGDSIFMVLKTARYVEHDQLTSTSEVVSTGEVMVFLGPHYVITVRHGEHGGLKDLRASLENQPDLLCRGPAAVLYAVADLVVDHFVEVASAVEEDVDELEVSVFSPERTDDIGRIYQLKRELMQLRRAVSPLDIPLNTLAERQVDIVPDEMRSYFRDVQDHSLRVRDQIASLDELLTSILQSSLARTSLADNEDMRKISAWAGIIAVPTAIAGIYGMNFEHMPELKTTWGYPVVLLVMLLACTLLYRGFKRSDWL